jgi:sugar lactone lactonase YvrE
VPSLTGSSALGLLYGEGVDPAVEPKDGPFFAYDMHSQTTVFESDTAESHQGFRNIAVDAEGRAYFSGDDNQLLVFDPATSTITPYPTPIPGKWLRASTVPGPEGTIYAATREPDQLFSFHPDGTVRDLGPAPDYVASLALDPDGTRFFYIPSAHGKAWLAGTPLMSVDTATGESEVLVELNELAEDQLGLSLGGTYGVVVSPSGDRLYTVLNSGNPANERDAAFGAVVLIIVDLP